MWSIGAVVCLTAVGAAAPEDDLSFLDDESVVVGWVDAWSLSHTAIYVDRPTACPTDEMMMVVVDTIFVPSRGSSWLDPAEQTFVGEGPQRVVDGLSGYRPDLGSNELLDVVGSPVGECRNGFQDRESLCGHLDSVGTENLRSIRSVS